LNRKVVLRVTGRLLEVLSLVLLLPMLVSLIYKESAYLSFFITSLISFVLGTTLRLTTKTENRVIYAREGFLTVVLAWLAASVIGMLPFLLSGEIPSVVDAWFETVSGLTTTGASILTDVTSLSHGMLFWRSFTHWIGGMGVLVFIIAFSSNIADRSIHIMRAEMPGPIVGKLVPRAKDTSKVLYIMYIIMTLIEIVLLWGGGMPLYDSVVHTFATAGTGGFGIRSDSIAGYSPYAQWVIAIFMLIFGVNFNLYYLMYIKRFKAILKSTELWTYIGIAVVSIVLITFNVSPLYTSVSETVRHSFFQVSSIMTTTGFATTDFNLWPDFSKSILLILMFIGACAGSTAGGIKISRIVIMFKMVNKEIRRLIHPRSITGVNFEGREVETHVQNSVLSYFTIYMICFFMIFLLLNLEPHGFETNFTAVASCFNNIGPGFAAVGPMGSFAFYSDFSKLLLSAAMLLGRLEIFPILIALNPFTWIHTHRK